MNIFGLPESVLVFTRDRFYQSDSLPKYLILPVSLVKCIKEDDLRIRIIDFGGGSLQ